MIRTSSAYTPNYVVTERSQVAHAKGGMRDYKCFTNPFTLAHASLTGDTGASMPGPEVHPDKAAALQAMLRHSRAQEMPLRASALELRKRNRGGPESSVLPHVTPEELIPIEGLTRREMEVWLKIAQGLTNAQIADALQISIETVRKHVGQILRKLGVENRTSAARKAYDRVGRGVSGP
jgi:DNA-binding CsgD family transcriptional regulator